MKSPMSQRTSNSLVNLGELSKPADSLIKKVSKLLGGFFAPYQVIRMAKAEAAAALIKEQNTIEITDLNRRAMHRFVEEEAQRQENIEAITAKALPQLKQGAQPDIIEDDWVSNFFDKSRIVSDDQMQNLWSRVLAGEANVPGTYSKRTVNFLSDLDKVDAEWFRKLCGFGWTMGSREPLIFDVRADIYTKNGISFVSVTHLDSIGLLKFNNLAGFVRTGLHKRLVAQYYGRPLRLELAKDADNELDIGQVLLTRIGRELEPICGSEPVHGFFDYVKERWKQYLPPVEAGTVVEADNPASAPTR